MIFLCFVLALLAIGIAWRRSARSATGYFLADRSLGAWQTGLAMAATAFGSSAILVSSKLVYTQGLAAIWFSLANAIGFGVLGLFFAARIRASGAHSLADYIAINFGEAARLCASLLLVVVELGFFALTVKGFALLARPLLPDMATGISDAALQAIITAVFVTYTMIGGHKAEVIADIGKLAIVGVVLIFILLPTALAKANWSALPPGHLHFPFNSSTGAGPLFMLNMLALIGLPSIIGGDVFSKVLSSSSAPAARRAMLIAFGVRAVLAFAIAALGLCARALLPSLSDPQQAIPQLALAILNPAFYQLIALALVAALLSTSDAVLITTSTVIAFDILRLGKEASVWSTRFVTLAVALVGFTLAVYFTQLLEIIRFSYTLLAAGISAPILIHLIACRKLPPVAFIASLAAGVLASLLWKLTPALSTSKIDPALIGATASMATMLIAVYMNPSKQKPGT